MQQRELANTLSVSAIGYGAMGLSEFYGDTNDEQSLALLQRLLEMGVSFIDTANMYGDGHNESLIGKFLTSLDNPTRQSLKIATKCGIVRQQKGAYNRSINNQPDYIRQCCDESLQQLGIECIDLFYLHRLDEKTLLEDSIGCLAELVTQGKIKHIGLCEVSAETLRNAHAIHPITALQTEYSLWTRDVEAEILPTVKELDIGFVPYSPLGRGFLTGKYRDNKDFADNDFRKNNERFLPQNLPHNLALLDIIEPIAQKHAATVGQIALAWLSAQYDKLVPIPGTKQQKYLEENVKAVNIVLSSDDLALLNTSNQQVSIQGSRYSAEGMKSINA